jgi:hypothetical protein
MCDLGHGVFNDESAAVAVYFNNFSFYRTTARAFYDTALEEERKIIIAAASRVEAHFVCAPVCGSRAVIQ